MSWGWFFLLLLLFPAFRRFIWFLLVLALFCYIALMLAALVLA